MKERVVFKTEASLWEMIAQVRDTGQSYKPFDMRRWDITDDRIYRLSLGRFDLDPRQGEAPVWITDSGHLANNWIPDEKEVGFVNKVTGALLVFEYRGVAFTEWAPGWGFIILGKLLNLREVT